MHILKNSSKTIYLNALSPSSIVVCITWNFAHENNNVVMEALMKLIVKSYMIGTTMF